MVMRPPNTVLTRHDPLLADLSVGLGYDTGAQGAVASVGTSEGLTGTNVRVGGKDVTARGALPSLLGPSFHDRSVLMPVLLPLHL